MVTVINGTMYSTNTLSTVLWHGCTIRSIHKILVYHKDKRTMKDTLEIIKPYQSSHKFYILEKRRFDKDDKIRIHGRNQKAS